MSEPRSTFQAKVIDLSQRRKRRATAKRVAAATEGSPNANPSRRTTARNDAAKDIALTLLRAPPGRSPPQRYVLEFTASRALCDKLMLAKLLLSEERDDATLSDVVEMALEIWLGELGRLPDR